MLNWHAAAFKARMGNQKSPKKNNAQIQNAERCTCSRSSGPAQPGALYSATSGLLALFPSLGPLLLYLGEDGALLRALLGSDCLKKICFMLHAESQEAQQDTRFTPASQGHKEAISAGHPGGCEFGGG